MPRAEGIVYKIFERDVKWKGKKRTLYSIKLDGDDNFYGTLAKDPRKVLDQELDGKYVEFDWHKNKNDYPEVDDVSDIKVSEPPEEKKGGGKAGKAYAAQSDKDSAYIWRWCVSSAIDFLTLAASQDALDLGGTKGTAKAKRADKLENLRVFVRETAKDLFREDMAIYNGQSPVDEEDEEDFDDDGNWEE